MERVNILKSERFKNIHINPIVKKDLRVLSRSMKIAWGIFAYEAVLAIVFLFAIWLIFEEFSGYGYSSNYEAFVSLFPVISGIEFCIIALLMPILTATAISGEKERQTFDILLTTVMTPRAIIRGKVGSAVIRVMVFMIASIPLMALSFTIGGLSWFYLLITIIAFLIFAILTGSFGIFASTLTKKSITAIILTYVFYFVFGNMSVIPTIITLLAGSSGMDVAYIMLINPVAAIIAMFGLMIGGQELFPNNPLGFWSGWGWLIISAATMIGFSILFQELAARRIDPLRGYVVGKNKKKEGISLKRTQPQTAVPEFTFDRPKDEPIMAPAQTAVPEGWAPGQENGAMPMQQMVQGSGAVPMQQMVQRSGAVPMQQMVQGSGAVPIQQAEVTAQIQQSVVSDAAASVPEAGNAAAQTGMFAPDGPGSSFNNGIGAGTNE